MMMRFRWNFLIESQKTHTLLMAELPNIYIPFAYPRQPHFLSKPNINIQNDAEIQEKKIYTTKQKQS